MTLHDDHPADRDPADPGPSLVDWPLAGRRLLLSALWLFGAAVAAWVAVSVFAAEWRPGTLGNFVGLALLGVFLVEVWVVGGSAMRGMLRAGDDGHRLSGMDVGLLPPQLRPGGSIKPALVRAAEERAGGERTGGERTGGERGGGETAHADHGADVSGPRG